MLPGPDHTYPVAPLHQPLAQVSQRIGHAIDFRRKSLGNNGNVLLAQVGLGGLGHGVSCGSSYMRSLWKARMTVMRHSRDIPFTRAMN